MRILITGGAGFLGSHLCDALAHDHNVICVDNFTTGREENIQHLIGNKHFRLIKHDIINPLFMDDKIDQIYNLACPASPIHYQNDAVRTLKTSVFGTINMLGMARLHKAKILLASTSEIYGDPTEHPQTEFYKGNVNPIGPRACYDEGKRCAETLMFDYNRQYSVDIRVVRVFNTYGPRMNFDDGRVVINFITQAINNEHITIYGDGSQTRSFCYVDDMISGMISMMNQTEFMGPVNLGNPQEFTILEVAEKVISMTGSKSKIIYMKLPEDDPSRRRPDITIAIDKLGWQPKIVLDEGLMRVIRSIIYKFKTENYVPPTV